MCIIAHALKKRHMKREEVLEAMRVNPSGFFMAALRADGSKETIRTLEQKEAIAFFDDKVKDDDEFVMHARIPSRGAKSLDNVHGWESDGIYFMHNMTISTIDSMMTRVKWGGTDSEFFFRKIFIPYYRMRRTRTESSMRILTTSSRSSSGFPTSSVSSCLTTR